MDASDQRVEVQVDLRRAMPSKYELQEPQNGPPRLTGYFAVWNEWAEINSFLEGHFLELSPMSAFVKTVQENRQRMRCLFQHGEDPQIGSKVLGDIEVLELTEIGAYYEIPLFDTKYNEELLPGLRAGVYGSSHTFAHTKRPRWVQRPAKTPYNPSGLPERTLVEVRVKEFGPAVFHIYEGAIAGARSATDEGFMRRMAEDPDRFREVARRAGVFIPDLGTISAPASRAIAPTTDPQLVNWSQPQSLDEERRAERLYKRAAEYALETPWAVTPRMMAVIQGILRERVSGIRPSQDEIQERIDAVEHTRSQSDAPAVDSPVAVINVMGTIMPHAGSFSNVSQSGASIESLQEQFQAAIASDDVKAVLLNIDSPGGSAALIAEFATMIRDARGTKPIVAVANTNAASAAYWIATAADELRVSPSGKVGSIGVYSAHTDISAKQEMAGEKTTLVSAGDYKVEGNPFEPLSAEAKAQMQKTVDAYYQMFVDGVAKGRGVTAAVVKDSFGQGRMVMAQDAVECGMADKVATYEQTLAQLEKQAGQASRAEPLPQEGEPEPSVAATRMPEPEPSVATTQETPTEGEWMYGLSDLKEEPEWTL
jgi:capsid assembly protease